jgi:hypothetical protein
MDIRRVINNPDTVHINNVKSSCVYFFFDKTTWFYITGDMYTFRNLEQTNGWNGGEARFKTRVKSMMNHRFIFEVDNMFDFVEYIKENPDGPKL